MQKIALPFVACLLALATVGAQAQTLWKWRDAAGQLHISDKAPPPGTPAKDIISAPPGGVPAVPALTTTAAPTANAAASDADTALDKKKKAADKERIEREKADRAAVDVKNAAIRKDNCSRAQTAMSSIQSGQRLSRTNANGEREYLDDSARAEEMKRTQDAIASNCGAAPAGQ